MSHVAFARAAVAVVTGLFFSIQTSAFANPGSPAPASKLAPALSPAVVLHALKKTVISSGTGGALGAGFTTINSVVVKCPAAAGCTFGVESMVQVIPSGASWAICPSVDGVYSNNPPCPYQGLASATGDYVTGNGREIFAVTSGNHTVNLDIYMSNAAQVVNWESDVRIYAP